MNRCVVKKVGSVFVLFLISVFIVGSIYVNITLSGSNFESIMYYSICTSDANWDPLFIALKICVPIIIILAIVFYTIFYDITFGKRKFKYYPFNFIHKYRSFFIIFLLIISVSMVGQCVSIYDYLIYSMQKSDIIKNEYVDPRSVKITFPDKKKNLIVITVESLENTLFTKDENGIWDYEVIPELYDLLSSDDGISFNNKKGMYMLHGSSYTTGSIVANSSAVPIKVGFNRFGYAKNNYMNGIYSLGDLLEREGYKNEVISGAATSFGGLDLFYKQHGNYSIIDPTTLNEYGYKMSKSDYGNWGFNDKYLFELAKKRLDILEMDDKPFNLELITIDTHFVDGFVSDYSETKFSRQYENAYATTSRLINDFISYVKSKSYYENTSIVIMGDHLTMQSNFINNYMFDDRTVYFCIIDSEDREYRNDRIYTALDTYPTIVSLLNADIEENRLGLGVNLFSNEKTLAEVYGIKNLDKELKKKSLFYDRIILGER